MNALKHDSLHIHETGCVGRLPAYCSHCRQLWHIYLSLPLHSPTLHNQRTVLLFTSRNKAESTRTHLNRIQRRQVYSINHCVKTHPQLRPESNSRNNPHQSPHPLGWGCLGFIHSPLIHSSAQETTSGNSHDYPLISVSRFAAGADSEDSQSHTLNSP